MVSAILLQIIHPGQILFGLSVLLFGSAFTLSFLIGSKAHVAKALIGVLSTILFLLLGTVAIEFSNASTPSYTYGTFASLSEALSTHRWLLFQFPIILTITNIFILLVYGERIQEDHARLYRTVVMISIGVSFASLLSLIFESLM